MALVYFDYLLQALWFSASPPPDIGDLSLFLTILFRPSGFLALLHQTYMALAYFDYLLQALWFSCSPSGDIGGFSLF